MTENYLLIAALALYLKIFASHLFTSSFEFYFLSSSATYNALLLLFAIIALKYYFLALSLLFNGLFTSPLASVSS